MVPMETIFITENEEIIKFVYHVINTWYCEMNNKIISFYLEGQVTSHVHNISWRRQRL